MANTYTLISSNVLASSAASVTFSAIPSTYTDLVIRYSGRTDRTGIPGYLKMTFNGTSSVYSDTGLNGNGATASSNRNTAQADFQIYYMHDSDGATANTFGSAEIYIPNYAGSSYKPVSAFGVGENNATTAYIGADASLFSSTAAITSIALAEVQASRNWLAGSSFYLYGIKNS